MTSEVEERLKLIMAGYGRHTGQWVKRCKIYRLHIQIMILHYAAYIKDCNVNFFVLSCVHVFVSTVCVSEENYKKAVCNLLPKLKTLDGEL